MNYLLGVDLGTSGTKTVLFDGNGQVIASATVEYPMYQPHNGWAEQDADDWWEATKSTVRTVLENSGVNPADVKGLGISGQMHGLVLIDENGNSLCRSLIWCDGRTQAECDEITAAVGAERLIQIAANPALTGFTAGKVLWVRKNQPDVWAKAKYILLPKDYVRYKLTGVIAQEISDASGTNLLDVPGRCWSEEICKAIDLDMAMLPPLVESCEVAGTITEEAAKLTGLVAGTPVAGGGGDNMCGAVGTGVVVPGKAFTTIGTSGVVYAHSPEVQIEPQGRVHAFCSCIPGEYVNFACTLSSGLSLKWFRDQFCQAEIQTAKEMDTDPYVLMNTEAANSPIGANRLLFLPYLMGERSPLMDNNARGAWIGLTAMHTRKDLLRALMEGVIYALCQNLNTMREMGVKPEAMLACGGGAKSPFWRQMMADVFKLPVKTLHSSEGPALGAAILAGVAAGLYKDVPTACAELVKENEPVMPIEENVKAYEPYYEYFLTLYPALKEAYAQLAKL